MKKIFIFITVCLCMFISVVSAETTMNFVEENGSYTLTLTTNETEKPEGSVYITVKDNGELECVESVPIEWVNNTFSKTGTIAKKATDEICVYAWDENMIPIEFSDSLYNSLTEQVLACYCSYDVNDNVITYVAEKRAEYNLSDDVIIKVNGVQLGSKSKLCEVLDNINTHEELCLKDNNQDKIYEEVSIRYCVTDVVSEVVSANDGVRVICCGAYGINLSDNINYKLIKNGAEIEVSDLKMNDVLSIEYNMNKNYKESDFYNIYVSDKKVEGVVNAYWTTNTGNSCYTIGENNYIILNGVYLNLLENYTVGLDIYGDIAVANVVFDASRYAIVDRMYQTPTGEVMVRLVHTDGTKGDYVIANGSYVPSYMMCDGTTYLLIDSDGNAINNYVATADRFVEFRLNSSNEVQMMPLPSDMLTIINKGVYSDKFNRIGACGISDETIIINAAEFAVDANKDVKISDKSILFDEMEYTAVFLGRRNTMDGTYPIVYLLTVNEGFYVGSKLQISAGNIKTKVIGDSVYDVIPVYNNDGTQTELVLDESVCLVNSSVTTPYEKYYEVVSAFRDGEGVPFVAATNQDGFATQIYIVADKSIISDNNLLLEKSCAVKSMYDERVSFIISPVVKKYDTGVALATDMDVSYQSSDVGEYYTYSDNVTAYVYNGSLGSGFRLSVCDGVDDVSQSIISNSGKDVTGTMINWKSPYNFPTFAIARIFDDDIQEIYSINNNY